MSREKPPHERIKAFVVAHLGKRIFGAFTGADWSAWIAFVYLLEAYSRGGGDAAVAAMASTVTIAQHNVRTLFVQAIPGVLDWGDVKLLWPRIVTLCPSTCPCIRLHAIEREPDRFWRHGVDAPSTAIVTGPAPARPS